jgi:hypothetical protein
VARTSAAVHIALFPVAIGVGGEVIEHDVQSASRGDAEEDQVRVQKVSRAEYCSRRSRSWLEFEVEAAGVVGSLGVKLVLASPS